MVDDPGDDWVSGKEAGRLAGVNPATIWRAAKDGLIGYRTSPQGGVWRYRKSDLEKWIHSRRPIEQRVEDLEKWRESHEREHP